MRPPLAVRVVRFVVPVAFVGVVGTAVAAASWPGEPAQIAYPAPPAASTSHSPGATSGSGLTQDRDIDLSRERARPSIAPIPTPSKKKSSKPKSKPSKTPSPKPTRFPTPKLDVTGSKYATTALNIRTVPAMDSRVVTVVAAGTKLSITKSVHNGFRYISYRDKGRWVRNQYLSDSKPKPKSTGSGSISGAPCPSGSKVEIGLTQDAIRVHRALCARFPKISSFGGRRSGGGFHGTGQALDVMISGSAGWDVAYWVRANAKRLGVSEVLFSQKIWTVQRGSEGWRSFSDRGSSTANHYDHVHVSVYGNRGSG